MGIFDKIKGAIWGNAAQAAPMRLDPSVADALTKVASASVAASGTGAQPAAAPQAPASTSAAAPAPAAPAPASSGPVDIAAILDGAVTAKKVKLNWRTSIVDLMKALDLDSDLASRKELASELGYTGSTSDSAAMNVWLHKAVIQKLKDNGGKVPADLLD